MWWLWSGGWPRTLGLEGIEAIVFRTVNDQPTLWESILPAELLVLPGELARVDALLDDPVFFAPFVPFFDARIGRPSIPMETYLRLMFLKFRYRLGYESLCREVADSISWQRFCRIPLGVRVPHPTTLMKITTRCGDAAVAGLNEALLAKAAAAKLLRTDKVRADTTVVGADVAYPTDSGLLAKAVGKIARTVERVKAAGGATRTRSRDRRRAAGRRARSIASKLRLRGAQQREEAQATVRRITGELADLAEQAMQADAVIRNGRAATSRDRGRARTAPRASDGSTTGRLRTRALDELDTTLQRTAPGGCADPDPAERRGARRGDPAGQPARPGRQTDPQGTAGQSGRVRLQGPGRRQRRRRDPRPQCRGRQPPGRTAAGPGDRTDHPPHRPRHRGRSPPTEATAKPASNATCTISACAASPFPARANPAPPAANSSIDEPSATRSNGAPDPKDASTTSNAATDGTAPNSPPSPAPEPGADTACSPTTWSRSARWQPDQPPRGKAGPHPPRHHQPDRAVPPAHHDDRGFFRSK